MLNSKKSDYFLLTWNNPKINLDELSDFVKSHGCTSFAGQLEKGESGTPHYQFLVRFPTKRSLKSVRDRFPKCHVEPAKNSFKSYEYCTKLDTRVEGPITWGKIPTPSTRIRGDTKRFNDLVLSEGPASLVASGELSIERYPKVLAAANLYKLHTAKPEPLPRLDNFWIHGEPGCGKTSHVQAHRPYPKNFTKWWDGYANQDIVLLDDLDHTHKWISHYLKIWGDHYPFLAEVKGGSILIRPAQIVVTSNYRPAQIWQDATLL